jgi:hypothetical protein
MARRRLPPREGLVETIGGIRITRRRAPAWILVMIVFVVTWGLFYLINFSVSDTGTFQAPEGAIVPVTLFGGP